MEFCFKCLFFKCDFWMTACTLIWATLAAQSGIFDEIHFVVNTEILDPAIDENLGNCQSLGWVFGQKTIDKVLRFDWNWRPDIVGVLDIVTDNFSSQFFLVEAEERKTANE